MVEVAPPELYNVIVVVFTDSTIQVPLASDGALVNPDNVTPSPTMKGVDVAKLRVNKVPVSLPDIGLSVPFATTPIKPVDEGLLPPVDDL